MLQLLTFIQSIKKETNNMRAAIFYRPGIIEVEQNYFDGEIDRPQRFSAQQASHNRIQLPKKEIKSIEKGILIKVNACAVCGYDVRVFRSGHQKVKPPVILGHEICGRLQSDIIMPASNPDENFHIGTTKGAQLAKVRKKNAQTMSNSKSKTTTTLNSGSRVAVCPIIPCLNCTYCGYGKFNLCNNLIEIGSTINGGFAEFVKIPERVIGVGGLVPVPDSLNDEQASLLEPLACCLNGIYHTGLLRKPHAREPSRIAIIGDGPIGLLHLQLMKKFGKGAQIMVIGKKEARTRKAKDLGADATALFYNDAEIEDPLKNSMDFTNKVGFNLIVIATSNPVALDLALRISSKNATINIFAGMQKIQNTHNEDRNEEKESRPNNTTPIIDPNFLHYNQISITGSFSSTPSLLRQAAGLASRKEVDLSTVISHKFSLQNIHEAFRVTEDYEGLRAIINKF
jgi:L-iditol 2-dehydrogenase